MAWGHLTDGETEAQGCDVSSQRSHSTLGGRGGYLPHSLSDKMYHTPPPAQLGGPFTPLSTHLPAALSSSSTPLRLG